ncbi:MAG: hypothetical protein ABJG88_04660, partial [Litorimonas sp.]
NSPVRGVTIEALDGADNILESSQTDATGQYSFEVDPNTQVRIRVKAEMVQTAGTTWNVRVQDNTSNDALYVLDGALLSSGTVDSTRNLNADAGWGTTSYTRPRVAPPFAILDPIFDTLQEFQATVPGTAFPPAFFNWSVNNISASGERDDGEIGTSSYIGNGMIFILGEANQDVDEYDEHVVVHEWGHYFEDQLSRSDSIGGAHSLGDRLDFRLAFSEGFGNAIAAVGNDDPVYRDSGGTQQAGGFSFNIENQPNVPNNGWFSETSVQEIIYDVFDTVDDTGDTVSLGLGAISAALTSTEYTQSPVFTTIFTFMDIVKAQNPDSAAALDALLIEQNINGTGPTGLGETNAGGFSPANSNILPVYKVVTVNGPPVIVCSVDDAGGGNASDDFNNLGTRDFMTFSLATGGSVTLTAQIIAGMSSDTDVDPDFFVFNNGNAVAAGTSNPAQSQTITETLPAGDYAIEFFDFDNLDETLDVDNPRDDGDSCYNFTITQ